MKFKKKLGCNKKSNKIVIFSIRARKKAFGMWETNNRIKEIKKCRKVFTAFKVMIACIGEIDIGKYHGSDGDLIQRQNQFIY